MDKERVFDSPAFYRIRVGEELGPECRWWFDGFEVSAGEEGGSVLTGIVADQAALHGLLRKLRDLGLTLVALERINTRNEKGGEK